MRQLLQNIGANLRANVRLDLFCVQVTYGLIVSYSSTTDAAYRGASDVVIPFCVDDVPVRSTYAGCT
jgi:hypothetical protein